jgi:hypothetical protein
MSSDIIERLYESYQNVSAERQRISVPIDLVIKEAGLWDSRESARQALFENRRLLQLDEGDWASADADTKAVHLIDPLRTENRHGELELRKLTMMAFIVAPDLEKRAEEQFFAKLSEPIYEIYRRVSNERERLEDLRKVNSEARHFYELHPESGTWVLTDVGEPIARFNNLKAAEQTCCDFQEAYAAELESRMELDEKLPMKTFDPPPLEHEMGLE